MEHFRKPHPRSKFTPEEDEELKVLVSQYSTDWKEIAVRMKTRDPRQCRERWTNYLCPTIIQPNWTERVDRQLEACVAIHGRRWSVIQTYFPDKTDTALKNRYNLIMRRHAREVKIALGQPLRDRSMQTPIEPPGTTVKWAANDIESDEPGTAYDFEAWEAPMLDPWEEGSLNTPDCEL
jgi:hypothetical protein